MNNNRISELDSLRGIAALFVVLFHYTTKYSEIFHTNKTTQLLDFKYGHYGVQLFFIISGFVIFMTINNVKKPLDFIFKRFIRLYPVYWLCLIITTLVTFNVLPGFGRTLNDFTINFTMIPSLLGFKPIDGAYWSLIPELFFYAMMLGLLILKKLGRVIIFGFLWLLLMVLSKVNLLPSFLSVILNLNYGMLFLAGMNFYFIFKKEDNIFNHIQIFICFLISFLGDEFLFPYIFLFFISVFYLFVYSKLKFLNISILIYIGKISYALYLLHQFIGYTIQYQLLNHFNVSNPYFLILIPLCVSVILAITVTELYEKPILKWMNNRYNKKRNIKNEMIQ